MGQSPFHSLHDAQLPSWQSPQSEEPNAQESSCHNAGSDFPSLSSDSGRVLAPLAPFSIGQTENRT